MTHPVIHRVTTLDLGFEPWRWPFADDKCADIEAHFAAKKREKPIWNGRILLGRDPDFTAVDATGVYFSSSA